jgi:beta-ketodecanoyl-[acyl-carrier-protein] synthase
MNRVIISGIGVEIPPHSIGNDELVACFNGWVERENVVRQRQGLALLAGSSAEFIAHASGILSRRVHTRDGILDPDRMTPRIPARGDGEMSVTAEFGVAAARKALDDAGVDAEGVDLVICASSHLQRLYPAIAIEMQDALGAAGAAFDMSLGCSSAVAGIHAAFNLARAGAHRRILVVTPELITPHLDFRDRQTHFIFGDAAVAVLIEAIDDDAAPPAGRFEIVDTRSWTRFSNAIRSDFGYLNRAAEDDPSIIHAEGKLIRQLGNKVFKEVTVAGHRFIVDFLAEHGHTPETVRRFWLHQANARMNAMILKLSFGTDADPERAPLVLDRLGNTAAAGAIIAMSETHGDLAAGDYGLLCAFGAGYSIGGALLRMS